MDFILLKNTFTLLKYPLKAFECKLGIKDYWEEAININELVVTPSFSLLMFYCINIVMELLDHPFRICSVFYISNALISCLLVTL